MCMMPGQKHIDDDNDDNLYLIEKPVNTFVNKADTDHACLIGSTLLMEILDIIGRESKPRNSDFHQNNFLSSREYQTHDKHSVKFS